MIDKKIFEKEGFIIDTSNSKDAPGIVSELMTILELPDAKGKKICLKVGSVDLTQSQILTIKALIDTLGSFLEILDTDSQQTEAAAKSLNITVEKFANEIEIKEPECDIEIKEIEVGEPKDGLSYALNDDSLKIDDETKTIITEVIEPAFSEESGTSKEDEKNDLTEEKTEEPKENTENTENNNVEENVSDIEEEKNKKSEEEKTALEEISNLPTFYLKQNLRSGQTMSYDGNVVLIGDAKPGSEIIAKGDITIWGILGGIAHAGARGNDYAKIRALKIHAIQLRISGYYARRPDSINIPFIQRTDTFTPEEARVNDDEIAIYKISEV